MKTISMLAAALGCAALAAPLVNAAPESAVSSDATLWLAGSSDGAGLPGLPGGRGGASGRPSTGGSRSSTAPRQAADPLWRYCVGLLNAPKPKAAGARNSQFRPGHCTGYFGVLAQAAQSGQPGRGGDGGGLPGLPGGRGGESGLSGGRGGDGGGLPGLPGGRGGRSGSARAYDDFPVDAALVDFCVDVLQSRRRLASDDYTPFDCVDYLLALDRATVPRRDRDTARSRDDSPLPRSNVARSGRDGADGASVAGGVGGRGGQAGTGSGGGRGGAGGIGLGGGVGGRGGRGGSTD